MLVNVSTLFFDRVVDKPDGDQIWPHAERLLTNFINFLFEAGEDVSNAVNFQWLNKEPVALPTVAAHTPVKEVQALLKRFSTEWELLQSHFTQRLPPMEAALFLPAHVAISRIKA
jgi:hypothetical protein